MALPLLAGLGAGAGAGVAGSAGGLGGLGGLAQLGLSGYLGDMVGGGSGDLSKYTDYAMQDPDVEKDQMSKRSLMDMIIGNIGGQSQDRFNPMSYAQISDAPMMQTQAVGLPSLMGMTQKQQSKKPMNSPIYTNPYVNSLVTM